MLIADIVDNRPVCPVCKEKTLLSGIRYYEAVTTLGNDTLTMFQCKYLNCNNDIKYLADIKMSGTKRYKAINYKKLAKDDVYINEKFD